MSLHTIRQFPVCVALLAAILALPAAPALAQVTCTITAGDAQSYDGSTVSLSGDTLTVEEGGNWQFTLTYKCSGITDPAAHEPYISISNPGDGKTSFDVPDFRGGLSKVDGVGDGNLMTGKCLEATGCKILFFGASKDNNCHNLGANVQRFRIITQINNRGTASVSLTDVRTFIVEATDDDPPFRDFFGTRIPWRPNC